jgi:FtsP/CotA-like multicopper oxidase with cupredoxin domain
MNMFLIYTGSGIAVLLIVYLGYRSVRPDGGDGAPSVPDSGRRGFLTLFGGGAAGVLGTTLASWMEDNPAVAESSKAYRSAGENEGDRTGYMMATGEVDHEKNGFDPMEMLVDWDYGDVGETSDGQTVREYGWLALDKTIEIAPGVRFPAWTYEGRVPGPTIRCTEGDRIRIRFRNAGSHPHTIHFHGIHSFEMDGVPGAGPGEIAPGEEFTYEFDAEPYGCHLYHCHSLPLKRGSEGGTATGPGTFDGHERVRHQL